MDFCSQIVRNVELPASLSDFSKLTKLKGGIILKDAAAVDGGLRVEGDLLWEGYAMAEHGENHCVWEGAEYFSDVLSVPELRFRDPFMLEPEVLKVEAALNDDNSCALTFSVRWWEEERQSEEKENFEKELMEINESFRETVAEFEEAGKEDDLLPPIQALDAAAEEDSSELSAVTVTAEDSVEISTPTTEPTVRTESKVTEICNDFRELRKKVMPSSVSYEEEMSTEVAPIAPANCYQLRFYRASEEDTLETIADRFSVSLAKMRRVNELDEVGSVSGRLVRLPRN